MDEDDEAARAERARKLRAEIDALAKGGPTRRRPRSPSEFIEEQMRDRAAREGDGDGDGEEEEDPS
jgi:hypothetical protein